MNLLYSLALILIDLSCILNENLVHDFETLCICHLENIASLSHVGLKNAQEKIMQHFCERMKA